MYCSAVTSAFGQSAYIYTDSWVDDSMAIPEDGQNGQVLVVGSGVVEFELGHMANMQVKITSPKGEQMTESGTWTQGSNGMTLITFINAASGPTTDLGNFVTQTSVQITCPYEPAIYDETSLLITQDGDNTIYYEYNSEQPYIIGLKNCHYTTCYDTDQHPANNCYIPTFNDTFNEGATCPAGIVAIYRRVKVLGFFSTCYRVTHNDYPTNPCVPH